MRTREQRSCVTWIIAVLVAIGLAGSVSVSTAADADIHAGIYTEADAVGVGAGILTHIGNDNWYFNPNADLAFGDVDLVALNGDFHYDFASDASMTFWAGAGPALMIRDSDSNLAVNLLAGFGAARGSMRPFGQVKAIVADHAGIALTGGVRF